MIKVVFLGTPSIGASALQSLINNEQIEVVAVVTTVDKVVGRSHSTLKPTPVATLAEENNIKVIKTNSINKSVDELRAVGDFDFLLTCAFGQFLSDEVLSLPKIKALNVHGSLLPEGRGGAPLHWAVINGRRKTGISIMEMVSKMDAGDYYSQYEMTISLNDTVDDVFKNMSELILDKTAEGVIEVYNGKSPTKQDESKVTFWMNVSREDAKINFSQMNIDVHNQIRGLTSHPGAWTTLDGKVVKIHNAKPYGKIMLQGNDGEVVKVLDEGLLVNCKGSGLLVTELTVEGKKRKVITKADQNQFEGKQFI